MFQDVLDYLEKQIIKDEGERLRPYTDTAGKVTIGRGRNLTDRGISKAESKFLYDNDVAEIITQLDSRLPWWRTTPETTQYVLMNLCFMGIGSLLGFRKMLAAMLAGDGRRAAKELLDSDYAREVSARAQRLATILDTGSFL